MAITRRKSPQQLLGSSNVLAVAICLFVSTEMASAWNNICNPGDLYIDSSNFPTPASCSTNYCGNWCKDLCSSMGTLATQDRCTIKPDINKGDITCCKCCCQRTPPSPCDPPYPAPGPSDWEGPAPFDYQICTAAQTLVKVKRTDGKDCISKSLCKDECSKLGLLAARTECVANFYNAPGYGGYNWYEQCCCGTSVPPPPPPCPSPPPPPPPPCPAPACPCNTEVNVTISINSGKASSPSTCAAL
ncbi:hypothetical protein MKW94_016868 [Papaver nudicaule]|uniref:Uncharacterized protein n=1 Tax=Papaver nudicaule TaxID=74823 RepID=A0AA41UZ23_PAPNU|nr:hypothetical protein [Papaver nudicaule]MCL7029526.1 hypothetical protein [Papaver nudicaule]